MPSPGISVAGILSARLSNIAWFPYKRRGRNDFAPREKGDMHRLPILVTTHKNEALYARQNHRYTHIVADFKAPIANCAGSETTQSM